MSQLFTQQQSPSSLLQQTANQSSKDKNDYRCLKKKKTGSLMLAKWARCSSSECASVTPPPSQHTLSDWPPRHITYTEANIRYFSFPSVISLFLGSATRSNPTNTTSLKLSTTISPRILALSQVLLVEFRNTITIYNINKTCIRRQCFLFISKIRLKTKKTRTKNNLEELSKMNPKRISRKIRRKKKKRKRKRLKNLYGFLEIKRSIREKF